MAQISAVAAGGVEYTPREVSDELCYGTVIGILPHGISILRTLSILSLSRERLLYVAYHRDGTPFLFCK